MSLEIPTNKTPGDVIRRTPASRPQMAGLMILVLTGVQIVLAVLTFVAVAQGHNSPVSVDDSVKGQPLAGIFKSDQQIISSWLAGIFFCLAWIIFLYQRFFMDHITIAKRRFRKWEDEGVQVK